jgi:hypothetical protein
MLRPCPCCHSFETESLRCAYERGLHRSRGVPATLQPPKKRRVVVLMALMVLTILAIAMRFSVAAIGAPDGPERFGGLRPRARR